MVRVSDFAALKATHDPSDMYGLVYKLPEQLRDALEIAHASDLSSLARRKMRAVCVAGLGGSAIGGDLVRSYLQYDMKAPMQVVRHYTLPGCVDKGTLVVASSYSGNTEETLAATAQAKEIGCPVLAITSGGRLADLAAENGWPRVAIPSGYPPRAAIGYSFAPLLVSLGRLGFVDDRSQAVLSLAAFLEGRRDRFAVGAPPSTNTALSLAMDLVDSIAIVYAGQDRQDAVAVRFKGQICENSKSLAFANVFPEFNHNELVGYKVLSAYRDRLFVIILRDSDDHPRVAMRMDIVKGIIESEGVRVVSLTAEGADQLQRMWSHVQLGDFASYYLALANGVDPTPVKVIDYLKGELSRAG